MQRHWPIDHHLGWRNLTWCMAFDLDVLAVVMNAATACSAMGLPMHLSNVEILCSRHRRYWCWLHESLLAFDRCSHRVQRYGSINVPLKLEILYSQ